MEKQSLKLKNHPDKFREQSGFNTLKDLVLTNMLGEAAAFIDAMPDGNPYCLSFLGDAGTGKTMLAQAIHEHAYEFYRHTDVDPSKETGHYYDTREIYFKMTDTIAGYIFDQHTDMFQYMQDAWLLVIDDFGTQYDKSGFILSKLFELINRRMGKWTVLTSNLTLPQIAQDIDPRIASRLVRDGSRVVDCSTKDFSLRQ